MKEASTSTSKNSVQASDNANATFSFVIKPGEKWRLDAFARKPPERIRDVNGVESSVGNESQSSSTTKQRQPQSQQNIEESSSADLDEKLENGSKKCKIKSKHKKSAMKQLEYCQKLSVPRIRENRPPPDPYSYDYYYDETTGDMSRSSKKLLNTKENKEKWDAWESSTLKSSMSRKQETTGKYVEYLVPLKTSDSHNVLGLRKTKTENERQSENFLHVEKDDSQESHLQQQDISGPDASNVITTTNIDRSRSTDFVLQQAAKIIEESGKIPESAPLPMFESLPVAIPAQTSLIENEDENLQVELVDGTDSGPIVKIFYTQVENEDKQNKQEEEHESKPEISNEVDVILHTKRNRTKTHHPKFHDHEKHPPTSHLKPPNANHETRKVHPNDPTSQQQR